MNNKTNLEIKGWPPRWVTPLTEQELADSKGWQVSNFINALCIQTKDTVAGRAGTFSFERLAN